MSRVDLKEFLDAYLGEVDELLVAANTQLLALDAALRAGEPTLRPIRELFRALHTVKGLSAMVGVEPVVTIAHRLEAALRDADRAGGRLNEGAVDALLRGVEAIEQRVRALASGKAVPPVTASLLGTLDALEGPLPPPPPSTSSPLTIDPAVDARLAAFERDVLARGLAGGRRAVCVWFVPTPERAAAGTNITAIRERLATRGEIVKVVPVSAPRGGDAPAGLRFALLALTAASDVELAESLALEAEAIDTISLGEASGIEPAPAEPAPGVGVGVGVGAPLEAVDPHEPDDVLRRGTVRVDIGKLDDALERLSALVISRATLGREVARLAEGGVDVRELSRILREQARQLRDLRAAIFAVRMVPVAEMLERVPLLVRGLRRSTGRSVRLELDAGRAELDKAVAERVFPAVVHLVRNAVDHAIEPPDERARAGKPEEGCLRIHCAARGNGQLELVVEDDGRGIDAAALAQRAGCAEPESEPALLQLLCRPGLSSRDEASTTSGRGMGMDIVRRIVNEELGGELRVRTVLGAGTRFVMCVPLTLSIVDALTFECAAQRFVVPMSTIDDPRGRRCRCQPARRERSADHADRAAGRARGARPARSCARATCGRPASAARARGAPRRRALGLRGGSDARAARGGRAPAGGPPVPRAGHRRRDRSRRRAAHVGDRLDGAARRGRGCRAPLGGRSSRGGAMSVLHVIFQVGGSDYAIAADDVLQMESFDGATAVPNSPKYLVGIVQVRGRVIPVIDLRVKFGLPPIERTLDSRVVVAQLGERVVGLLVDAGREVARLDPHGLRPTPPLVAAQSGGLVRAIGQLGPRMVLLVDVEKLLSEERAHGD